jgi:hypothetical protein
MERKSAAAALPPPRAKLSSNLPWTTQCDSHAKEPDARKGYGDGCVQNMDRHDRGPFLLR